MGAKKTELRVEEMNKVRPYMLDAGRENEKRKKIQNLRRNWKRAHRALNDQKKKTSCYSNCGPQTGSTGLTP